MIKKVILTLSGIILLGLSYFYFQSNASNVINGDSNNFMSRLEWEYQRLRDPLTGEIPANIRALELAYSATLPSDADAGLYKTAASLNWTLRGPWNVGGRTRAFAIDITDENILIAGTPSGGIWRSVDGGSSWNMTNSVTGNQSVTSVVQDKRNNKQHIWYYGTGEAYGASASWPAGYYLGNGIYKSLDSGKTWTSLPSTSSNTPQQFDHFGDLCWNLAINNADTINDVLYSAGVGAVYRSLNGGTTWGIAKGTAASGSYSYFTDVHITPGGTVYLSLSSNGSQKGIWRSTDGINYTNITPTTFPAVYNRLIITSAPSDETQLYILGNTPGYGQPDTNYLGTVEWNSLWKYKYLSGDGSGTGGIWQDLSANLPTTGGAFDKFSSQGSYNITIKVKPNDTNTVFIGGTNLYRSTSGFQNSTNTSHIGGYQQGASFPVIGQYANHHPDNHALEFLPSNPNVLFSAHDGGISKTLDNTASTITWTSLNNGYITGQFYTIAIDHAVPNSKIVVGGLQDNGSWYTKSLNTNFPWVYTRGGDGSFCAVADSQKMFYFSSQNAKILKMQLDTNGNKLAHARIDPIGGKDYTFINPFVLDPNNNNIMYLAGGKNIWRNNNLGGIPLLNNYDSITTNWTMLPDTVDGTNKITALAISKNPANRLYYGTNSRSVYRLDNANTGTPTPVAITGTLSPNGFPNGYVSCIAVDPRNADNVIVVFANYSTYSIYSSRDGGSTWEKAAGNLEQQANGTGNGPSVRWISILPVSDGTVYLAATSTGLYATDTLIGLNTVWVKQGATTIGDAICDMIDVRQSDGLVAVATHARGVFTTNITSINDIVSINDLQPINKKTTLSLTVFPNPIKNEGYISFELKTNSTVNMYIIDALGKTVNVIYNNQQFLAGKYNTHFNRKKELANGIYYVVLRTNTITETNKIIFTE